ncbi:MAG: hypothetical protein QHJ73_13920, partial [Armatimonadota bacterium]|nr:hypothetical protein [Armatimonadota bacterium]
LKNLVEYYAPYRAPDGVTAVVAPAGSPVERAIGETGVRMERVENLAAALDATRYRVVVVPATAANLGLLLNDAGRLQGFTDAGGWVMLWGLERDGLSAFNRLTEFEHQIRPFRIERVTLEAAGNPLVATLGNRDFTFYDSRPLLHGDFWLSGDVYTSVVGAEDVAPFCKMPGGPDDPFEYQPTFDDKDPYNFVNGMLNSDFWRYIRQIWVPESGAEPLEFGFRRPETIRQINLWNNTNYLTIRNLDIVFDGDTRNPVRTVLPPHGGVHEVKLDPPRRVERSITLYIRDYRGIPRVRDGQPLRLVGLDNVQFLRVPPEGYGTRVQPLDNIGGLVAYPRGKGGMLLNQVKLMDQEAVPANAGRKIRLVATLLQNMGAAMRSSSAVLVPGLNVQFTPLDLTRFCNRYLQSREGQAAWFGDRNRDLRHFTVGQQFLADVLYHVSDYATAPVPQVLMLGGPDASSDFRDLPAKVEGIPVNRKADALFFLHAARVRNPVRDDERRRRGFALPEVLKYVVHYADGSAAEIPVVLEENIEHWLQKEPRPLPGARVAWSVPFPGAAPDAERPVLYSMGWNNPRPETPITTIDVVLGRDGRRATPAVLAVSVGSRK